MRTPSISSAFYAPKPVPNDAKELGRFLDKELATIAAVLELIAQLRRGCRLNAAIGEADVPALVVDGSCPFRRRGRC